MTVVDIRNIVTDSRVELISIHPETIYYAEEKNEEGHRSLFILEYDRQTGRERTLANYFLTRPSFVQHFFDFPGEIVMVMENGGGTAWLLRLDKKTGEEKALEEIHLVGGFFGCQALDEEHMVFFTCENTVHRQLFRQYREATGLSRIACLYDLTQHRYVYIRDPRICDRMPEELKVYTAYGQKHLLVLSCGGTEEEKERLYQEGRQEESGTDRAWLCPVQDFIREVLEERNQLSLRLLLSAGGEGLLRFAGMDDYNLYFRAKYFPTGDQRICAVSKGTVRKEIVADLNLKEYEGPAFYYIDTNAAQVFRVEELPDGYHITGALNSMVDAYYTKELGEFVACIEDRFLVARYEMTDEDETFTFYSVYDSRTDKQQSYECRCTVQGKTVVLY